MYDFHKTISRIKELDWHKMLPEVEKEARSAESAAFSGKSGCVRAREMGAVEYASKMKSLAFFLGNSTIPAGATLSEIKLYREIAENLVCKKQFKAEVLNLFERT